MIRMGIIAMADDAKPAVFVQEPEPQPAEAAMEHDDGGDDYGANPNAGSRREIKERQRRAKVADDERKMVLQSLLQVEPGRNFIAWLICDISGVFVSCVDANLNPQFSMHREGQRAVGLVLQEQCLRASPAAYMAAIQQRITPKV